ncbi:MAG: hypothetical protein JRG72_11325 [Deltaproteobacteria bacterium]|nr:hypothetical protein [Deltaproteobacteria bacterium]
MAYHDYDTIREQARGRWSRILLTLAPELETAVQKAPRHVPCPVHGGKDGFRLFGDWEETGGGICNTCGNFPSGFREMTTGSGNCYGKPGSRPFR